ncbi:Cof-type HAD-IIB family hydrolase [Spiroplasma culicicola]|uniref:HAD superfamily hydrolase n=1 Tax=Spiroplasma culicicola AES-1 TaxID=1276246 RepID=W6A665_9MOLU|nr:Cof-type HAD-IIB family hydrolase [Spiroplasma culicicola]AHI52487.1 HAD superfamily hydrolase [Spiroplasma culicicola AES-1]
MNQKETKKIMLFSDLDGTALQSDHTFNQVTIDMVKDVYDKGHYFIPITARSTKDAIFQQAVNLNIDKHQGIAIANNGTHIYDFKTQTYIREAYIDNTMLENIFKTTYGKIGKYKVHYFSNDITYVYGDGENSRYWSDIMNIDYKVISSFEEIETPVNHLTIILADNATDEQRTEFLEEFAFVKTQLDITQYTNRVFELCTKGINKGEAVQYTLKHLGLDESNSDVYCFGDSVNDIPMFKMTQYPVAMNNAMEELKQLAKFHTSSNNEHGVANFINQNILREE